MSRQVIIGLAAAMGSGKDLAFKIIKKNFPEYHFERVAFADPIKKAIADIFKTNVDVINDIKRLDDICITDPNTNDAYCHLSGRDLIRGIGMLMRGYDETQFNQYVKKIIGDNPGSNFVITDVRFANEIEMIHSLGGYIVRIDRDECTYDGHVSETEIAKPDFIVDNNDDIDHFSHKLCKIVNTIIEGRA